MSLELRAVRFRYPGGDRDILADVDLVVARGESVAVMGPSGRGKSTLLGVAGLFLTPQAGEVVIDGTARTVRDAPELLGTTVAWVLQTVNLLPRRSVLDNVALPLLADGADRASATARAREMLATVELDDGDQQARTLSGGQAQRAGVARALMAAPAVLLADEPTANLDAPTAALVARALFRACADVALVVTTHDEAIAAYADRVVRIGDEVPAA